MAISLVLAGCSQPANGSASETSPAASTPIAALGESATLAPLPGVPLPSETPSPFPTDITTLAVTDTGTPLPTETPTTTDTPTETASPTPQPTYTYLRAEVIIEQAVCHYGPGAPYLYKYGVYLGSHLEVIRRVEPGNYLEIRAIGGSNPCWVKVDYLKIENNGALQDLEPVSAADVALPWSPYYAALTGVSAQRADNEVTVSWNALGLRAGDDSEQTPYIVEAWVCQQGEIVFLPVGSYATAVKIIDEPGCASLSRAWVTAAEKHGYTRRVSVPWPPAIP